MKKNMLRVMKRLEIDGKIRPLIGQMWKHRYVTLFSCDGDNQGDYNAYISFRENTGDGWFEKNARNYGLTRLENSPCCYESQDTLSKELCCCGNCGAGINGKVMYRGRLTSFTH